MLIPYATKKNTKILTSTINNLGTTLHRCRFIGHELGSSELEQSSIVVPTSITAGWGRFELHQRYPWWLGGAYTKRRKHYGKWGSPPEQEIERQSDEGVGSTCNVFQGKQMRGQGSPWETRERTHEKTWMRYTTLSPFTNYWPSHRPPYLNHFPSNEHCLCLPLLSLDQLGFFKVFVDSEKFDIK
jgi:hypothetical protein